MSAESAHEHQHGHGHGHGHQHGHGPDHGHQADQGWAGFLRYARMLPRMWRSDVSGAVVGMVAPAVGERVVDLGAGMGAATVVAARRGAHVLAVDPTPYMRRILGARRLGQRARSRITVVDGAAESIPAVDGSIDAVWSVNAMHHWSELDHAVAEIVRVLRPGGRGVLVDEDFDDPSHPSYERFKQRRATSGVYFDVIDPQHVAALFVQAGCIEAAGTLEAVAGRPAKVVRLIRS